MKNWRKEGLRPRGTKGQGSGAVTWGRRRWTGRTGRTGWTTDGGTSEFCLKAGARATRQAHIFCSFVAIFPYCHRLGGRVVERHSKNGSAILATYTDSFFTALYYTTLMGWQLEYTRVRRVMYVYVYVYVYVYAGSVWEASNGTVTPSSTATRQKHKNRS